VSVTGKMKSFFEYSELIVWVIKFKQKTYKLTVNRHVCEWFGEFFHWVYTCYKRTLRTSLGQNQT